MHMRGLSNAWLGSFVGQVTEESATIGSEVGYHSEAAFSRAFKKATGQAPGAWREVRRTAPA